mgnify:CR=1 FL=1
MEIFVQGNLEESVGRADLNEQALAKMKVKARAGSVGPMVIFMFILKIHETSKLTNKTYLISCINS